MINLRTTVFNTLLLAMFCLPISSYAATVGQQFRDIMAQIDAKCKKEKLGPYLDPNEPPRSDKRSDGSCEILKVKPADPLATAEGRFAYSIKLPPPHDKPKVEYRKGMSAETYFKELCAKEEGDFVFRVVDGVEGITIMRPLPQVIGIPLSQESGGPTVGSFVSSINGIYRYVDAVELLENSNTQTQLIHYKVDPKLPVNKPPYGKASYAIKESQARYGYTFRNSFLENREIGVVGQELIIADLQTNEILAFRRRFSRLNFMVRNSVRPMLGTPCRLIPTENSDNRFVAKILKPAKQAKGDQK